MSKAFRFDLSQVVLSVSPYTLSGKGEVSIEAQAKEDGVEISGDGEVLNIISNKDNSHIITLSVPHTSNAHRDLQAVLADQAAGDAGALPERAVRLYDPSNGDTWSDRYGWVMSPRPGRSMTGTSPGMVEYKILLPNPTTDLASAL